MARFLQQLGALLIRHTRQKARDLQSFLVELLAPLAFTAIIIILWSSFGSSVHSKPSEDFTYKGLFTNGVTSQYKAYVCYNATEGNVIDGLQSCQTPGYNFTCDGDYNAIPMKGLCHNSMISHLEIVVNFIEHHLGPAYELPPFDSIVIHQWISALMGRFNDVSSRAALSVVSGVSTTTRYTALGCYGSLYFAPAENIPEALIEYFNTSTNMFKYVYGGVFDTIEEAQNFVKNDNGNHWGIVEVRNMTVDDFDVVIHLNTSALPPLDEMVKRVYPGGYDFDGSDVYVASGFLSIQKLLSEYYLESIGVPFNTTLYMSGNGFVPYERSLLMLYAAIMVAFILVLSFLYSVSRLTKMVVLEKELRIREAMLIMGLNVTPMYLSLLIVYVVQYLVECLAMTLMLKLTILKRSDPFITFLVLYLFALTTIPFAGMMSTFFNNARVASLLAPLLYFVCAVPLFAVTNASGNVVLGLSVLSPTGFASAVNTLLNHEIIGGMKSSDLHSLHDSPTLACTLAMLAADIVLYTVLMLYLDAVLPKTWGTTLHPLFFITAPLKSVCGKQKVFDGGKDGRWADGVYEEDSAVEPSVSIMGLRKEFHRGEKTFVAVNNLYWSMMEGEISVLLGHNGAGKSTTMNMITGMLEPDAGDCFVYGKSVRRDLSAVRKEVGYCPQHNILWPELTCREHLEFFGRINGLSGKELDASVADLLIAVDLAQKEHYPSRALSGGQKRKLSLALAFVGSSRLVFLDEPTAGMDVGARRHTWELLQRMARNRTMLLTTHYMDEADLLGHRIGIMSHGRLRCSGSSLFLKSRLGLGYNLTLSLQPETVSEAPLTSMVKQHAPLAELINVNRCEMAYRLPSGNSEPLTQILKNIDGSSSRLGVRSYVVSVTTLEEIFITLSILPNMEEDEIQEDPETEKCVSDWITSEGHMQLDVTSEPFLQDEVPLDIQEQASVLWNCNREVTSVSVFLQQFRQMMKKRLFSALRDKRMIFFQIVCPMLCILLSMLLNLIDMTRSGTVLMSTASYNTPVQIESWNCDSVFGPSRVIEGAVVRENNSAGINASALQNYLLDSWYSHSLDRYGAVYCLDDIAALLMRKPSASVLFFNTSAYHEAPIGVANYYNGVYSKAFDLGNSNAMKLSAKTMPTTSDEVKDASTVTTILIGVIIMIPFTFLPSNVVAWVVKERECGARHLQRVSGVRFSVYWLSNFVFDMAAYLVTMFFITIIFLVFNRKEYVSADSIGPTIVLMLVFGFTSTAMAYALSFLFKEHSNAQTVVMAVSFATGFLLVMLVFLFSLLPKTRDTSKNMQWAFRLIPTYCIGEGVINLAMRAQKEEYSGPISGWDMDVVGWSCVYMAAEFPFFIAATLMFDHTRSQTWLRTHVQDPARNIAHRLRALLGSATHAVLHCCGQNDSQNHDYLLKEDVEVDEEPQFEVDVDTDSDVEAERVDILNNPQRESDLVRVVHLHHEYPNGKVAVKDVTFGIHPGEVFALLGTNGAGKTTTTSVLCQEFAPTSGEAYICGTDIAQSNEDALQWTGYCPQFDALLDLLTVEEHLYMYCGVRSIASSQHTSVVQCLITLFELEEYRNTLSHELSGGNKRKLSVAISLIGGPRVVLLDEPSAGMDPVARRGLWTAINAISDSCSVVLTTHHLEEVEALAHRVAIMVDGTLRCIGDKTHLKNKFGTGFEMSLRVEQEKYRAPLESSIEKWFPGSTLNEYHALRYVYSIPRSVPVNTVLEAIINQKAELGITDYTVSHTSIEQVFLNVSKGMSRRLSMMVNSAEV